ncbi:MULTISPECIES: efflux RND transporter periplasmic adaptor subunit [unclassified Pseudomonas]|uniref:efflux RND transporter periplasmic adaptor subunit n=1 Tax=unclassified Pseudomonas TaxID=196821 RepID=UPI002ACB09DF|nr:MULTISPECIES: efflux RND transporter periplasmic adaptor subunit [unclassified Pseudomonas]MEB0042061.1 efflux RND transporter periplasmic adaptor subunit [Pseudomonas sp. MH10]MEB0091303.1 efflux RND transporter periplasmic adaptor subunit [Pseudomonas sp. CCI4.2]MEB0119793.1 efflux RND transporter periplasmic adaptor subunit [Pseudomonas sp. CCI1.2]WPX53202.1 efflux RND transporter periplasmic adaptor subunit [Pseudomonas sp. CCI4.2]WPX65279.1 efflux RND transporter periplasmic adaptor su
MNTPFRSKTSRITLAVIAVVGLGALGFFSYQAMPVTPATPVAPLPSRVTTEGGLTIVTLDEATQTISGIQSEPITASKHQVERLTYGSVLGVQGLNDLNTRYSIAQADSATAHSAATASGQEYERNASLYKANQSVSLKVLQASQVTWSADKAKLQAADASIRSLHNNARQQFGAPLANMIGAQDAPQLQKLLSREDMLLRIVLPLGVDLVAPELISVESSEHRETAQLISVSPQVDPSTEGRAYLYRAAATLPVGSKVVAYLPLPTPPSTSLVIPEAAILWFGGQPWAYVQIAKDRFTRRPVAEQTPYNNGYLVSTGFESGDRVVVQGAQLLLSEEQRPPITASACKDPECDD